MFIDINGVSFSPFSSVSFVHLKPLLLRSSVCFTSSIFRTQNLKQSPYKRVQYRDRDRKWEVDLSVGGQRSRFRRLSYLVTYLISTHLLLHLLEKNKGRIMSISVVKLLN